MPRSSIDSSPSRPPAYSWSAGLSPLDPSGSAARPAPLSVLHLPDDIVRRIATYLSVEDRYALRLSSSLLQLRLKPNARTDAVALKIDQVITPSSFRHVASRLMDLPPADREPLLDRLALRATCMPLHADFRLDEHLYAFKYLLSEGQDEPSQPTSVEATSRGAASPQYAAHIPILRALDQFDGSPELFRGFWHQCMQETLTLPAKDQTGALAALASTRVLHMWPELFDIAECSCPENMAAIYEGIAGTLRVFRPTGDISDTVRRLTDGMADLPLHLRIPVLARIAQAWTKTGPDGPWTAFLQYVNDTVPPHERSPILLAMVSFAAPVPNSAGFLQQISDATVDLPPEHRDGILATCVRLMGDGARHGGLDAAFHIAMRLTVPAHRHQIVAALAEKREWLQARLGRAGNTLPLLDMVADADSQYRWRTIAGLLCSIHTYKASHNGWMTEPIPGIGKQNLAALDDAVMALPDRYRGELLRSITARMGPIGCPAWQWAFRIALTLRPAYRADPLIALCDPPGHPPKVYVPFTAAVNMVDAAAGLPPMLRAAVMAAATHNEEMTGPFAGLLTGAYAAIKLGWLARSVPPEDRDLLD